ncbi:hydrolase, partial [Staphylococcus aureus]
IKKDGQFVYESLIKNDLGLSIIHKLEEISKEQTIIACTKDGAVVNEHLSESEMRFVTGSYTNVLKVSNFADIQ